MISDADIIKAKKWIEIFETNHTRASDYKVRKIRDQYSNELIATEYEYKIGDFVMEVSFDEDDIYSDEFKEKIYTTIITFTLSTTFFVRLYLWNYYIKPDFDIRFKGYSMKLYGYYERSDGLSSDVIDELIMAEILRS